MSSPGVERPLRKPHDFEKFSGRRIRIHTYRPLESSECENPSYWDEHQRQKNFIGRLEGLTQNGQKVRINVDGAQVAIPLTLISKAHLEFIPVELDQEISKKKGKGELIIS